MCLSFSSSAMGQLKNSGSRLQLAPGARSRLGAAQHQLRTPFPAPHLAPSAPQARLTSEQEETTLLLTVCVLAPCDRNIPAVTGAGWVALQYMGVACAEGAGLGAGLCWHAGTTGMRAKLEPDAPCSVRQWEAGLAAAPGSPRLAMTCRCWSCPPVCWAASCSCTNIMWSPTRRARVSGDLPDRKSLTWGEGRRRGQRQSQSQGPDPR